MPTFKQVPQWLGDRVLELVWARLNPLAHQHDERIAGVREGTNRAGYAFFRGYLTYARGFEARARIGHGQLRDIRKKRFAAWKVPVDGGARDACCGCDIRHAGLLAVLRQSPGGRVNDCGRDTLLKRLPRA